jgi:hypothetical protein
LERKKEYVSHVRHAPISTQLVSASDKLHNVRALLRNYREEGDKLWDRYSCGKKGAFWYYRALVSAFHGKRVEPLKQEIDRVLGELEYLSNAGLPVTSPPD